MDLKKMKVLAVLCPDYWMKQHLIPTLRESVRDLHVFFYKGMAAWSDREWVSTRVAEMDKLVSLVTTLRATGGLDAIFSVAYDDFFLQAGLRRIKQLGVVIVNYHVDMPTQWYRCIRTGHLYDVLGSSHLDHMDDLRRYGAHIVYAPMAANTKVFAPVPVEPKYDVVFAGGYSPARADAIAAIREVTPSVAVYGAGWTEPRSRSSRTVTWQKTIHDSRYLWPRLRAEGLSFRQTSNVGKRTLGRGRCEGVQYLGRASDLSVAFGEGRIVLGVNQRYGDLGSSTGYSCARLRDFEAPACAATYLVQWHRELDSYYPGGEVVSWKTLDDLKNSVDILLSKPRYRKELSAAARDHVVNAHQWHHRYERLFGAVGHRGVS